MMNMPNNSVCFQNCVEQPFDSKEVFVSKNTVFMEEFAVNIRDYLTELEARIGRNLVLFVSLEKSDH